MSVLDGKTICQIALVVDDLEKVALEYAKIFGVPVPETFNVPPVEESQTRFKGELTDTRAKLAVFDLGQVVLELTEPDAKPSSWKDFKDHRGCGVHHIAFMTEDRPTVVKYFEENEMPVRHYGEYQGGSYTVFDSLERLGIYIQVKDETGKR